MKRRAPPHHCGKPMRWYEHARGVTVGGNTVMGAWGCTACTALQLGSGSKTVTDDTEHWKIAGSGRSVETGFGRIRVEGCADPEALMRRIVRLPELERMERKRR